jgi:hypothetical protein
MDKEPSNKDNPLVRALARWENEGGSTQSGRAKGAGKPTRKKWGQTSGAVPLYAEWPPESQGGPPFTEHVSVARDSGKK